MLRPRSPKLDDEAIYRIVVDELVPHVPPEFAREVDKSSITRRLDRNETYVLAKGKRRPFGFISFRMERGRLLIDMLALDRSFQHRGWGSFLMNAAEQRGRLRGCRESMLYVDESNWRAQRFYCRHGYALAGYTPLTRCFLLKKTL
jgi:ribosomal protein S18 acetylase RimI-like enzyme